MDVCEEYFQLVMSEATNRGIGIIAPVGWPLSPRDEGKLRKLEASEWEAALRADPRGSGGGHQPTSEVFWKHFRRFLVYRELLTCRPESFGGNTPAAQLWSLQIRLDNARPYR